MIFLTYWFVAFACVAFPVYWFVPNRLFRRWFLLVTCAVFHTHFAGPAGVAPILVLAVATYLAGLSRNKAACDLTIALCVASLVFYKYTMFICREVLSPFMNVSEPAPFSSVTDLLPGAPPLAISFFVFEFVHYLVEVRRGGSTIRNVVDFSLFSIFWPSIVAGPVKRYQDFIPALERGTTSVGQSDVAIGVLRVAIGLVKKFVADNLTAYITFWGAHYSTPAFDTTQRWVFVVCIAFRILLDFSGYSDMAIGFARMMGIGLPENFNWPYLASNLQDFWRRWHISLSTWIRDYIYIALGGGRVGPVRKIVNGLLAFGICGLWHGAGWNFLAWGLMHGVGLAISTNYRSLPGGSALGALFDRAKPLSWLLTLTFVFLTWLFFFYPIPTAWAMLKQLFSTSA